MLRLARSVAVIAPSMLIATLVFVFQWHYGFNWGDEGWLWYISQRTALGDIPMRDVFSYDPGRYYWSAAVFRLLGRSGFFEQILANYAFAVVGLAVIHIAMVRVGMSRAWRVVVLLLLGVAIGFPRHKIFEQVLSLIAVAGITYVLARPEQRKRWFIYGLVTGLAAFFGGNSGLYFLVAALLVFLFLRLCRCLPNLKLTATALLTGIVAGYSPMFFMMLRFRGFTSAFIDSVLLTPRWSWSLRIPFPWHSHANALHGIDAWQMRSVSWLCLAVPITYVLLIWWGSRGEFDLTLSLAVGASIAGVPYLHHAFYHADFFHIAQAVLPFLVAVAAFSQHLWNAERKGWSVLCLAALVSLMLSCWLPMEPLVQHFRVKARTPMSLALVTIDGRNFEVSSDQAIIMRSVRTAFERCRPHDGGFLEAPYYPGLYAFLKTRAPFWDTYYLWPRSDEFQEKHIEALITNQTSVVLLNRSASFDGQEWLRIDRTYPKVTAYILAHYQSGKPKLPDGFEMYYAPR
jgi:hypothetical protein